MGNVLQELNGAYQRGGVQALELEAARRMPPDGQHGWAEELVMGCADPELSVAASWLLLDHAKKARPIPKAAVKRLVKLALPTGPDDARLHLCQLVQHLEVPKGSAARLAAFLDECTLSGHAFVRAWATDGLYRLSLQHAEYEGAAASALELAACDPKASVKARARRIESEREKRKPR